jgi:hypothetical protein
MPPTTKLIAIAQPATNQVVRSVQRVRFLRDTLTVDAHPYIFPCTARGRHSR